MKELDWNDLRYLLAMARGGSATGAARALHVSHATVLRRLQMLEQNIGVTLFDRLQTGYVPTTAGQRFIDIGEAFERSLSNIRREVEGQETGLTGPISFTTTDSLADSLLPEVLHSFHERFPAITVEMRVTNARLDLELREADVALRPTHSPPEAWIGRPLARMDWGLYTGSSTVETEDQVWLLPDNDLALGTLREWLHERTGNRAVAATADSFVIMRRLVQNRIGASLLPCFMVYGTELKLLELLPRTFSPNVWLLTHPHLRDSGRVKVFMEHMTQQIQVLRGRLEINPN